MKSTKGFTLIELLIAISIFSVVIFITSALFIDAVRLDRKTSLRQQVYMDSRHVLDQTAKAIHDNAVDYNEYYNQIVLSALSQSGEYKNVYGANHGAYTALFYDPGLDENGLAVSGANPDGTPKSLGQYCNNGTKWGPGMKCTILQNTVDEDTGRNLYNGDASAIKKYDAVCGRIGSGTGRCNAQATGQTDSRNLFDELYLISPDGRKKIIFVKESIKGSAQEDDAYAVSYATLDGEDKNGDMIADSFVCAQEFDCGNDKIPSGLDRYPDDFSRGDTEDIKFSKDFVPISPTRINVQELKFYIAPLEDPFYAFAENDPSVQKLPHVTIIMKVKPNKNITGASTEDFTLDLQETVSTTLLKKVETPVLGQY